VSGCRRKCLMYDVVRLAVEKGVRKGRKEERERIVTLIEQGGSLGDIKKMLSKEKASKRKRV